MRSDHDRLPAGRQPYDSLNGLRIGALVGGLVGAAVAAVARIPWLILAGAAVGGGVGFWFERRKIRSEDSGRSSSAGGGA